MRRRLALGLFGLLVAGGMVMQGGLPTAARADARSSYLVRLLEGSSQFRVRAQAAISLAKVGDEPGVIDALLQALRDAHPAVRAAAATALGRLEATRAIAPLKALASDPEKPVRSAAAAALARLEKSSAREAPGAEVRAPIQYYVAVGPTASRVEGIDQAVLAHAKAVLRRKLGEIDGVEVAPDGESNRQARRLLKKRELKGFFIDSSITSVQQRPGGGTRVVVSLILGTYPGRDMRAIMHGAATAMGGGPHTARQAVEGAISGALRQLPEALKR